MVFCWGKSHHPNSLDGVWRRLAFLSRFACAILAILIGVRASAQVVRNEPDIEYQFTFLPANGSGGIGSPDPLTAERNTPGEELTDSESIPAPPPVISFGKHLEVYANEEATTFWAQAESPNVPNPDSGAYVGGAAYMFIDQTFRKLSPDATLNYEITGMNLIAQGQSVDSAEDGQMHAEAMFKIDAYTRASGATLDTPIDSPFINFPGFWTRVELKGEPQDFSVIETIGPGELQFDVVDGGLNENFVNVGLTSSKLVSIDLSEVAVGEEFRTTYIVDVAAWDTIQKESNVLAYGRDPQGDGTLFSHTGLEVIPPIFDPAPTDPVILSPTSVLGTDMGNEQDLPNMINRSGIDEPFVSGETVFDDYFAQGESVFADVPHRWQGPHEPNDEHVSGYIDFDLGEIYTIDKLGIWNVSLDEIEVLFATEEGGDYVSAGSFSLSDQTNFLSLPPNVLTFANEVEGRYMRIEVESNHKQGGLPFGQVNSFAAVNEVVLSVLPPDAILDCDFTSDGICDADDIDLLSGAILSGSSDLAFDLNGDGLVNDADRNDWISDVSVPSDIDLDGDVDSADQTAMTAGWTGALAMGAGEAGYAEGDLDGDGDVDTADKTLLIQNWTGATQAVSLNHLTITGETRMLDGSPSATSSQVVPEPTGRLLIVVGFLILTRSSLRSVPASIEIDSFREILVPSWRLQP